MTAIRDADVDAALRTARRDPAQHTELIALLAEDAPLYDGRSTASAGWIRAWLMAQFADIGLPGEALPLVLEVLNNDVEPRALAAAALASRGLAGPDSQIVAALLAALKGLRGRDESVDLRSRDIVSAAPGTTTAALEVLAALRWQPAADQETATALEQIQVEWSSAWSPRVHRAFAKTITALSAPRPAVVPLLATTEPTSVPNIGAQRPAPDARDLGAVVVEDQSGATQPLRDYLARAQTIVTFFYTRCQNPNKCSTTITKLAWLQRELATRAAGTQIAAITYDPGYDTPDRLLRFGSDRGMAFSDTDRMFRAVAGHYKLRAFFDLHVGYNGSIVNRHGIELFLVAADLSVHRTWSRVQWVIADVMDAVISSSQPGTEILSTRMPLD